MDETLRKTLDYAWSHRTEESTALLLRKGTSDVDMRWVAQQIDGWQTARKKWPHFSSCPYYLYPPRLNREQSSSEATARYKKEMLASCLNEGALIADLTGGMGIDSLAFAELKGSKVDYVECDETLCHLMEHNADLLGFRNLSVHCADSMSWIAQSGKQYDLLYLDPARRDGQGRKVTTFENCTPNIVTHIAMLKSASRRLLVKASPMMDIDAGASLFGPGVEVHVVAVGSECKELLFLWDKERAEERVSLHCVTLDNEGIQDFTFTREDEQDCKGFYATKVERYLYEPDVALMKGGPYKLLSTIYGIKQLAHNTHLYTSDELITWKRGRCWQVQQILPLNRKAVIAAIPDKKAHVITRNYPARAEVLQRQLGLTEGGDIFIVATTVGLQKQALLCNIV